MTTIETQSISLRPCVATDVHALHGLWTEAEARRWLWDGRVMRLDEADAAVRASANAFAAGRPGQWNVCLAGSHDPIGYCGLLTDRHPFFDGELLAGEAEYELFSGICSKHRRLGYASEAVAAVLKCGFESFEIAGVAAIADVPNKGSVRVLEKLGMEEIRRRRVGRFPIERVLHMK